MWKTVVLLLVLLTKTSISNAFRILYPQHPLHAKQADEPYQAEYLTAKSKGMDCSLFDYDALVGWGEFRPHPALQPGETVLYRGWMMTPAQYDNLSSKLKKRGTHPMTSVDDYTLCHHLPGWYQNCANLTAETHFFDSDADFAASVDLDLSDWNDGYFVKDYVKSNTGDKGSIAQSPADILDIVEQLKLYRGDIEGGIALRRVEAYIQDSEQRYFVVNQIPKGPNTISSGEEEVPTIVQTVAERIQAPFFSVDIAQTVEREWRVVELGDGQVSDKKEWPLEMFVQEVLLAMV